MKGIQEQSNTTTRIQCHEINFQNKLNLILIFRPGIQGFILPCMPCMPGEILVLNLIYFENLFRYIGFSSSYCFVPVYLSYENKPVFKN